MDFIKNALREFKHVVWPTREETKKYFVIVLGVLVAFGLYLFIVWNIFSEILFGLKNMINPATTNNADIQLPEGLEGLNTIQTGSTETTTLDPLGNPYTPEVDQIEVDPVAAEDISVAEETSIIEE